jgi:hypothetical protein
LTQMADFQIKKITLPSGKVVEILYLQPAEAESLEMRRIELCPSCDRERVHPLDWHEVEEQRWRLEVRCPDCRWQDVNVYDQPEIERYDDLLAADTDLLIDELERFTRENMEEHLERFRLALEQDVIEPMDF